MSPLLASINTRPSAPRQIQRQIILRMSIMDRSFRVSSHLDPVLWC